MDMQGIKQQTPGSRGCLWHWGNNVTLPQLRLGHIPEAERHPLTQTAK